MSAVYYHMTKMIYSVDVFGVNKFKSKHISGISLQFQVTIIFVSYLLIPYRQCTYSLSVSFAAIFGKKTHNLGAQALLS